MVVEGTVQVSSYTVQESRAQGLGFVASILETSAAAGMESLPEALLQLQSNILVHEHARVLTLS